MRIKPPKISTAHFSQFSEIDFLIFNLSKRYFEKLDLTSDFIVQSKDLAYVGRVKDLLYEVFTCIEFEDYSPDYLAAEVLYVYKFKSFYNHGTFNKYLDNCIKHILPISVGISCKKGCSKYEAIYFLILDLSFELDNLFLVEEFGELKCSKMGIILFGSLRYNFSMSQRIRLSQKKAYFRFVRRNLK